MDKSGSLLDIVGLQGLHFARVDLRLHSGELLCLYGASGSGKSQFLRALADLEPHEGQVYLQGVEQQQMPAHVWRRKLAYLPAESGWWSARVGAHFSRPPQTEDLLGLGLEESILQREVEGLSSGERQRLGLLRLLGQQPQVILLDEPSANLDPQSALQMEGCVRAYLQTQGAAAIWVSHDPVQRARIADRSLEMPINMQGG
ncbi:MAG: ATP-binding cassette domain-containing protein [Pseudomonadota bacterium]